MHILPGQKIAVIGGTGSGKSTLVQLLLSFRLPTEGQILFDGVSASQIDRGVIRKNISCVLQKTAVYSGTIRHNIEMGRPGAEETDILEAADIAHAVSQLPARASGASAPAVRQEPLRRPEAAPVHRARHFKGRADLCL